jgi:8-oxo-dGTP pyrophosphatase MutT (NUDIX family)
MLLDQWKDRLHQKRSLFIGEETAFRSAVLIPLVQVQGKWHILFEVRSYKLKQQPGDISFPGGRIDPSDPSPLAAALRETSEELGVNPGSITVIGELSPFVQSASFVIYPFVAVVGYDQIIHSYNKDEVEEVFTVPVEWLLEYEPYMYLMKFEPVPPPDFPFEKIMNGTGYKWRTRSVEEWFYDYGKYTIWGLTARILKHFIEIIK